MSFYERNEGILNSDSSLDFQTLKDKVLLLVNVASACQYTQQYQGLQHLQEENAEKGFSVIGFPCNQFGSQEPGSEQEIANFASQKFYVTFPLTHKVDVNGPCTNETFKWLKQHSDGKDVEWNFEKFLLDKHGNIVGRFDSKTTPEQLESKIDALLQ